MKIGIITFHRVLNYGAVLQAYALCKTLKSMGHDPFLIDYQPEVLMRNYRTFPVSKLFFTPAQVSYMLRWKHFNAFFSSYLTCSERTYHAVEELQAEPPEADAYICGSDQVWSPRWLGDRYDPAFFLRFGEDQTRIAYAASMGDIGALNSTDEFEQLISGIDHISVRESNAVNFVEQHSNRKIHCVIDPVFLMPDYSELYAGIHIGRSYTLIFSLNQFKLLEKTASLAVEVTSAGLRRITRSWKFWKENGISEFAIAPQRWVACFKQADAVITDSFHGTSFSILFRRPFLSVLPNHTCGGSHRILDMLQQLGLQERVVYKDDSNEVIKRKMKASIDWDAVGHKLEMLRSDSLQFLTTALGESGAR